MKHFLNLSGINIERGQREMVAQSLKPENDIDIVIKTYSDMVYRLAYSNLSSKSDADDIYQEVFLRYIKAIKKETTFESEEHRKAWFIRVTVNCCKSFHTSAWNRHKAELDDTFYSSDDSTFDDKKIDFFNAMKKLPQKYRAVLHLFYYEQLSIEDIATVLETKSATVRTHLSRARALMKKELEGDYFYE